MAKKPTLHLYSDQLAFERLMLLIATLVQYPGVGYSCDDEREEGYHDGLCEVQSRLQETAAAYGVTFPDNYPARATIRKDLETLRRYGILERRLYRWGYYLGTGAMTEDELKVAFNALCSLAKYQGDSLARRIHANLSKRLRGLDLDSKGEFFYPVRQHLNRAITHTDPDEMMSKGENRHNLFHQLDVVERAIQAGSAIEISRFADPYGNRRIGLIQVWPLQLVYHDIAWYLIYEQCHDRHLEVERIDRFQNYCQVLSSQIRSLAQQYERLLDAHKLIEKGWGLNLGTADEQRQELESKLALITIKVRFFTPVIHFILEGERRHPSQRLYKGPIDSATGELTYLDYTLKLPPRSLLEFSLWVYRYMDNAEILKPDNLRQQHCQAARALVARYL